MIRNLSKWLQTAHPGIYEEFIKIFPDEQYKHNRKEYSKNYWKKLSNDAERLKAYYERKKRERKARIERLKQEDPEAYIKYKEKLLDNSKNWAINNPEKRKELYKKYNKRFREKNPDYYKKYRDKKRTESEQ